MFSQETALILTHGLLDTEDGKNGAWFNSRL